MRCLNNVLLDDVILMMLKFYFDDNAGKGYIKSRTDMLIDINVSWKGNEIMDEIKNQIELAKKCGHLVSKRLIKMKSSNKIISYKYKLSSALNTHDYDRVKDILLRLSAEVSMEFPFFYAFLENAEKYKDIVFAFANSLNEGSLNNNEENN